MSRSSFTLDSFSAVISSVGCIDPNILGIDTNSGIGNPIDTSAIGSILCLLKGVFCCIS